MTSITFQTEERVNEGYTEQNFINVINKKSKEWIDTE